MMNLHLPLIFMFLFTPNPNFATRTHFNIHGNQYYKRFVPNYNQKWERNWLKVNGINNKEVNLRKSDSPPPSAQMQPTFKQTLYMNSTNKIAKPGGKHNFESNFWRPIYPNDKEKKITPVAVANSYNESSFHNESNFTSQKQPTFQQTPYRATNKTSESGNKHSFESYRGRPIHPNNGKKSTFKSNVTITYNETTVHLHNSESNFTAQVQSMFKQTPPSIATNTTAQYNIAREPTLKESDNRRPINSKGKEEDLKSGNKTGNSVCRENSLSHGTLTKANNSVPYHHSNSMKEESTHGEGKKEEHHFMRGKETEKMKKMPHHHKPPPPPPPPPQFRIHHPIPLGCLLSIPIFHPFYPRNHMACLISLPGTPNLI